MGEVWAWAGVRGVGVGGGCVVGGCAVGGCAVEGLWGWLGVGGGLSLGVGGGGWALDGLCCDLGLEFFRGNKVEIWGDPVSGSIRKFDVSF